MIQLFQKPSGKVFGSENNISMPTFKLNCMKFFIIKATK